jgi:CheY-like chemotaxis protein
MPGKRGLEAYREIRELDPLLPIVMVTKSEEDATLREAIGMDVRDYLVKPINPRQVLTVITRVLEGPRIRQQAIARSFVERFRAFELERERTLDWRGWITRYAEMVDWDIELAQAREQSLYESLQALYPEMRREFASYMRTAYPAWLADLKGDRPPLSVDVVGEFLLPVLERSRAVLFVVIDCLRLDQWQVLQPLLAPQFDVETTHHFSVLPTATPYSRNALFSGLFPGEIAARFPDWWGAREDESLNAHEKGLLEAHLRDLNASVPVRYEKISSASDSTDLERRIPGVIGTEGVSAFVFNFVDLLTHGRSESAILFEVARDEIALRQITRQWFERSALFTLLKEAARRGIPVLVTSDHGSIHCQTPATVFAKRDATANLRYKFGEDLRAERPEHALLFTNSDELRLPRRGLGANSLFAVGDTFFVYPTKLREYQTRYRGSFLHGGVTPEEVILPVALLTPRR